MATPSARRAEVARARVGVSPRPDAARAGSAAGADASRRAALAGALATPRAARARHARIVARLRERGHTLERDPRGGRATGRLAFGYRRGPLPAELGGRTRSRRRPRATGLEPALIERILPTLGFTRRAPEHLAERRPRAAAPHRRGARTPASRSSRSCSSCASTARRSPQIADAEVRLFHLYVHEPLMRDGVAGARDGRGDGASLARELLPLASPIMDHVHRRFLQHFVEQDVVGHMEADLDATTPRARAPARGDRVRRPRRLHAADRGGGRGGGARRRRALRRGGRGHAARRRARS